MSQKEIEIILLRQLASCLATPIFIIGSDASLLFYNEPAEKVLGQRFDETGEMSSQQLEALFKPCDENGNPIPVAQVPVFAALSSDRPVHGILMIESPDGSKHRIEATGFPIHGQSEKSLGAVSIFWELES